MLVKFIGAIERVTGSCSWLKKDSIEFLIDCGMVQGERHEIFENEKPFLFDPKLIKFVLLTHAHLDHCGLIPRLYKEGFVGRVYCTRATSFLSHEIMLDAAKIGIGTPYKVKDVDNIKYSFFEDMKNFKWGKMIPIDNDIFIAIYRSAHILGSVSIRVSWNKDVNGKSILFTGDIGNNTKQNSYQPLLKHRQVPDYRVGFIVCESTYGSREHEFSECNLDNRIVQLEKAVIETLYQKKGNLIIPTFSLHRTQEILFDLYYLMKIKLKGELFQGKYEEKLDSSVSNDLKIKPIPIQVICDSPLGKRISKIYAEELTKPYYNGTEVKRPYLNNNILNWLNVQDDEVENLFKNLYTEKFLNIGVHNVKILEDYKRELPDTPVIVITSSGMCDAGPALIHLENHLEDPKNTILLTGHQSAGTNGNKLSNLADLSEEEKQIGSIQLTENKEIKFSDIKANIGKIIGYSGHADQKSLLNYLFIDEDESKYTIPKIFLNHGTNESREEFKKKILERSEELNRKYSEKQSFSTNVVIPKKNDGWYDLDKNEWVTDNQDIIKAINNLTIAIEYLTKEISKMNKA
ncbi:MAG: MBL fold metallo-hydrolase [Nanoarchaeota archaeon]|nr:MBL fold metallo-hydrolase [Nanoarchaeota archaeon]